LISKSPHKDTNYLSAYKTLKKDDRVWWYSDSGAVFTHNAGLRDSLKYFLTLSFPDCIKRCFCYYFIVPIW